MQVRDVRYNILLQTDIDNLIDACSADKLSYEICNSKNFWINRYEYDGIPSLNFRNDLHVQFLQYKYDQQCLKLANILLNNLKSGQVMGMHVYIESPNTLDIFNVKDINIKTLYEIFFPRLQDLVGVVFDLEDANDKGLYIDIRYNSVNSKYALNPANTDLEFDLDQENTDVDFNLDESYIITIIYNIIYGAIRYDWGI